MSKKKAAVKTFFKKKEWVLNQKTGLIGEIIDIIIFQDYRPEYQVYYKDLENSERVKEENLVLAEKEGTQKQLFET